jgi:hypothetical protein
LIGAWKWGKTFNAALKVEAPESKAQLRKTFEEAWRNTGYPPQRLLANGERNLDPERSDGLAPPQKEPRVRRTPRAMVSSAKKGDVPVTLGGKLPPVSILSRREFGLRVLRR